MIVCICNAINDKTVINAINAGVCDFRHYARAVGIGAECGICYNYAQKVFEEYYDLYKNERKCRVDY